MTLTPEQIEHWRSVLIIMPLPPFNLPLGAYALIMPEEQIEQVVDRLQEILNQEVKDETKRIIEEEKPTNIIRTRPRKKNLVRR
jgi:hypothetical protein